MKADLTPEGLDALDRNLRNGIAYRNDGKVNVARTETEMLDAADIIGEMRSALASERARNAKLQAVVDAADAMAGDFVVSKRAAYDKARAALKDAEP